MPKRLIVTFALVILVAALPAAAQEKAPKRQPVAKSVLVLPAGSAKEMADILRQCSETGETSRIRVSCQELVDGFNKSIEKKKGIRPVKDIEELAEYYEGLAYMHCNPGLGESETRIARVINGKIDFNYKRPLRKEEPCFVDLNAGHVIGSAFCGQFTLDDVPLPVSFSTKITGNGKVPETTVWAPKSGHHNFFSWKRKTGKGVILGGIGTLIATGICAAKGCFTEEPVQTTRIKIIINQP